MELLDVGRILLGIILLVGGGELLVRGASSLATRAGLSSLVVGLTVVAAATSAPELAVTTGAVLDGETELAIGNVVGSNIVNVLLILGISALIAPLLVKKVLVRVDVPILIGMSLITLVLALDGTISRGEGVLLLAMVVAHGVLAILVSRRETRGQADETRGQAGEAGGRVGGQADEARGQAGEAGGRAGGQADEARGQADDVEGKEVEGKDEEQNGPSVWVAVVLVAVGVVLLVLGANVLVTGATNIASALGVSGLVVGLTVVAIGTSLPELATSVIATIRGERDMAVGNIVGSCIFNLGMVLGLPALVAPGGGGLEIPPAAIALDIPLMIAAAVALAPVAFTGYRIGRREGGLFVLLYAAYVGYLVLAATQHDALEGFTTVMLGFVLPLVAVALVSAVAFDLGRRKERRLTESEA